MQGKVADKTLAPLNQLPVVCYSIRAFLTSQCVDHFTLVYRDQSQQVKLAHALSQIDLHGSPVEWVQGGRERQDSVYHALRIQPHSCTHVFIHDAARPLLSAASIQALSLAVIRDGAAALAHPVTDSIKRIPTAGQLVQSQLDDLDRAGLWAMETPQAFVRSDILSAYQHVHATGLSVTDDTAAAAAIGLRTTLVPNHTANLKITTADDLNYAAWRLQHICN